jgi:hypothetical protein
MPEPPITPKTARVIVRSYLNLQRPVESSALQCAKMRIAGAD